MKTFLALTSMEQTIDYSADEIVCIENGCLKKQYNAEKFKCMDRPFHTAQEVLEITQTANEVYEEILRELALKLNEIHSLDLSGEAWRPILHMWLPYYIEEMYSKYLHMRKAMDDYPHLYTNVLAETSFKHPYYGYGCWIWSLKKEEYNFQLYSHVAQFMQVEIKNRIDIKQSPSRMKTSKKVSSRATFFNTLARRAETIVIDPGQFDFTLMELWKMIVKSNFKIGFFYSEKVDLIPKEYDELYRRKIRLEHNGEDSDFVRMIKEYIFEDIPTMYLEGFMDGYERLAKYRCKNIISAEGYVFHMAALLMGKTKNNGGKLYTVPLGGDGNIWQGVSEAYMDAMISDVLYTTGWKDDSYKCELRKITNPRYLRARQTVRYEEKKCDILYLATATFAYCTLMSNVSSIFSKEFMDDNISLMEALVKKQLKIRARFFEDTGWGLDKRIKALGENAEIDDYGRKFIETVFECKLCVMDSFGTAWAEALVMNVPFIIVIPKYMEFFTAAGWELVQKLRRIGIYFNNYQEVETNILDVLDDVELWWMNEERQKVLTQIANEYAWCSKNAKKEWIDEFVSVSQE